MEPKLCYRCDIKFEPSRSSQKFCSDECRKEFHKEEAIKYRALTGVLDICRCCGEEFNPNRVGQEFCSRECYSKYRYEDNKVLNDIIEKECDFCGEVFSTNRLERIYCSRYCADSMYRKFNKDKLVMQKKDWYNDNRERLLKSGIKVRKTDTWKDAHRDHCYRKNYGISLDDYNALLDLQKECCAICGIKQEDFGKNLFVDHDHSTGEVRGLLCHKCNSGLGMFNDDIKLLHAAIDYLGGDC